MKFWLLLGIFLLVSVQASSKQINTLPDTEGPWVVLLHYQDKADVLALKPFYDLWKIDEKNQTVLMMVNHLLDYQELIERGFGIELHDELMQQQTHLYQKQSQGIHTIDDFPCYRTVAETYAAMSSMETNYPDLVTLVDIGDSWHKTEAGGNPGYDMQVVKITNLNNGVVDKPKLFAMGSIHSREYPPAELVTRFAEYLLSQYGNNADVTWLLDYHEVHLLLQGNPDGRSISENQSSANQRKNRNENHCFGGNQQGVDINRNFLFRWNQGTGSSNNECSEIYRGTAAVSEPETASINNYIQVLFPDDRVDDLVTPAPSNKSGVYLDIHNVAELTLFPWGYSNSASQAPNHNELQTLARKMSYFTGYRPEQSNSSLGGADGASDDNAYGTLGVAAFTIELGEGGFYSTCNAFENTIWPDNLPALIYAAKAARKPYVLASGPDVVNLPMVPYEVSTGHMLNVSGTATDLRFNNSNGTEATQDITTVKAFIDIPSWRNGSSAIVLNASDGTYDAKTEDFNDTIDTSSLTEGRHTVWFEATDAAGVTGVPAAVFVDVIDPADLAVIKGYIKDSYTFDNLSDVNVQYGNKQTLSDASGFYTVQSLPDSQQLVFSKTGYFTQVVDDVVTIAGQEITENILLEPTCDTDFLNVNVESFDDINDAISAGWLIPEVMGSNDWRVGLREDGNVSNGQAFISTDVSELSDKSLVTPELTLSGTPELVFWHKYHFESGNSNYDGGVLEISTDGGSAWVDLGAQIPANQNGYNGTIYGQSGNVLAGRQAFVDSLGSYTEVRLDLSAYNNQTVKIRWRMGTDSSVGAGDWKIDDIRVFSPSVCEVQDDVIFVDGFENGSI